MTGLWREADFAPFPVEEDAAADEREILIEGLRERLPFSKGVLLQSLLSAAIDPMEAFGVAREIEHELLSSGVRTVSRDALRALARCALERTFGTATAARYLRWRDYREPDEPVVLLLGGTSGVGKSSLALEVARRLEIGRVQSTDSIRQVMRILLSRELVPVIYGSSYDAYRLLPKTDGPAPGVVDGFRAQAAAVAVGIRASLDRTVAESANLVIDGVSIAPGLLDLDAYGGRAHVVLLLITAGEEALRQRFDSRAHGQRYRLAQRYLDNFEGILAIQHHLEQLALRHGVDIIENVGFETSVQQIITRVLDGLPAGPALRPGSGSSSPDPIGVEACASGDLLPARPGAARPSTLREPHTPSDATAARG